MLARHLSIFLRFTYDDLTGHISIISHTKQAASVGDFPVPRLHCYETALSGDCIAISTNCIHCLTTDEALITGDYDNNMSC